MPINPCRNPQCEYFNKSLPSSAKVCPWCGEPLVKAFPPGDAAASPAPMMSPPLGGASPPAGHRPMSPLRAVAAEQRQELHPLERHRQDAGPPIRPVLKLLHAAGREFRLPGESGFIGRSSPTTPIVPEIDLKGIPNDGIVSRGAHARFYWDAVQQSYMVVDNSSRNGTFLNGVPLKPDVPYRVSHGAALQLGQDGLVCFTVVLLNLGESL